MFVFLAQVTFAVGSFFLVIGIVAQCSFWIWRRTNFLPDLEGADILHLEGGRVVHSFSCGNIDAENFVVLFCGAGEPAIRFQELQKNLHSNGISSLAFDYQGTTYQPSTDMKNR